MRQECWGPHMCLGMLGGKIPRGAPTSSLIGWQTWFDKGPPFYCLVNPWLNGAAPSFHVFLHLDLESDIMKGERMAIEISAETSSTACSQGHLPHGLWKQHRIMVVSSLYMCPWQFAKIMKRVVRWEFQGVGVGSMLSWEYGPQRTNWVNSTG